MTSTDSPLEADALENLHKITSNINIDLTITLADVMNIYLNAIRRQGRTTLLPNDTIRILHIVTQIQEACAVEGDRPIMPGSPVRKANQA